LRTRQLMHCLDKWFIMLYQWCMIFGRLLRMRLIVIPTSSSQIPFLLGEFHDSGMDGHSGFLRTFKRISASVFWKGIRKQVKDYIARCQVCQQNKYEALFPAGLFQPLSIPQKVWAEISMDFITELPKSKGKDTILVVIDRLSKFAHFIPLSYPFTAKHVVEAFIPEVVNIHGFPSSIVSNWDRLFLSKF